MVCRPSADSRLPRRLRRPRPAAGDVGAEAAADPGHNEADRPTRVDGEIGFFAP